MKAVFNKAKVKSWIKKAHKRHSFGYGHGYITDGYVMLVDEPHMRPTILEVFGTLTPECKYTAEQFERMAKLPNTAIEVIDSRLEFILEPKRRLHIFYDPKTGEKLTIDSTYFDLLDNPEEHRFYANTLKSTLWIVHNDETVGVIAPFKLENQLSHISFKTEEGTVEHLDN
jgi:hypothetical protein